MRNRIAMHKVQGGIALYAQNNNVVVVVLVYPEGVEIIYNDGNFCHHNRWAAMSLKDALRVQRAIVRW